MRVENLQNPTDEYRNKYRAICKSIKKLARRDRRNYFNKIAEDAQQAAEINDSRLLYKSIKQLSNRNIRKNQPIRDENGTLLTSNKNQIERWSRHFEENHTPLQIEQVSQGSTQYNRRININPPTIREVKEAIEKLKNNKAEGIDGIPAELLKTDSEVFANILLPSITQIWSSEEIPKSWKEGIVIKLPKKGDLSQCENWRGITILNSATKVLATTILNRIELQLRDEQAGFRRGRSCIDNSNTLRQIIEQSVEWNSPLTWCSLTSSGHSTP